MHNDRPAAPEGWSWQRFPDAFGREISLVGGLLFVTGGVLVGSTVLLPTWPGVSRGWVAAAAVVAIVVGAGFLLAAGRVAIPPPLFVAATGLGALLITLLVWAGGPRGSAAYGVLYVFVAAYAFYYYPRWVAVGEVTLASVGYAAVLLARAYSGGLTQWWLVVGASVIAGALIGSLGQRNRTLLLREQATTAGLEEIDRWRTTFLQTVAHDLRSPLTSLIVGTTTLRDRLEQFPPEQQRELLAHAVDGGERLRRMLDDLLDVERIAAGHLQPRRAPVALDALVRETAGRLEPGDHPTTLDLEPVTVAVEAAQVERIVDNLVANAYRHTPPGTNVTVRLRARDDGALLTVEDDGPGIADEDRAGLFEPFQGGHDHGPDANGSSGLGLALVARFTQLHEGRVWVEDRPGGGARFHVLLPGDATSVAGLTPPETGTRRSPRPERSART